MRRHPARIASLAALIVLALAACGTDGGTDATADDEGDSTLTVFAAASLRAPFEQLATDLEAEHPGLDVRLSFAGSSDLAAQVTAGARADVLATADERTMATVTDAGLTDGDPTIFATNSMTIAVPEGNPAGVNDLEDLADEDVAVVLCAPQVPCGAAAERVEDAAGVDIRPVSEEAKVTDVVGKVAAGEADAGIVYVTDVSEDHAVESIEIPAGQNASTRYPIAPLRDAQQPKLARDFVGLVLDDAAGEGRDRLSEAGFGPP